MSTIRIHLLSRDWTRVAFLVTGMSTGDTADAARQGLEKGDYVTHEVIGPTGSGEMIAEEMFDLTNNPSREDERMKVYGTARSISVGDIVEVAGEKWLCRPVGWCKI